MEYMVKIISDETQLGTCDPFPIKAFNWGGSYRPNAYGCMAIIENKGFFIKLVAEESNPAHQYYQPNDPVYLDSALEVFFQFDSNANYFNFEMNSNGVLYAQYGDARYHRTSFTPELLNQCKCKGVRKKNYWYATLFIPFEVIFALQPMLPLKSGDTFLCNFFKLKENEGDDQHFASWNPIQSEEPNFHLTEFFGKATIA